MLSCFAAHRVPACVEEEAKVTDTPTRTTGPSGKRLSTAGGSNASAAAAAAGLGSPTPRLTSFSSSISHTSPFAQVAVNAPPAGPDAAPCDTTPAAAAAGGADAAAKEASAATDAAAAAHGADGACDKADAAKAAAGAATGAGTGVAGGVRVCGGALGTRLNAAPSSLELSLRKGSSLFALPGGLTGKETHYVHADLRTHAQPYAHSLIHTPPTWCCMCLL